MQVKIVSTSANNKPRPVGKSEEYRPSLIIIVMGSLLISFLVAVVFFQIALALEDKEQRCDRKITKLVKPCIVGLDQQLSEQSLGDYIKFGCCSKYILQKCFGLAYNMTDCNCDEDLIKTLISTFLGFVEEKVRFFSFEKPTSCKKYLDNPEKCYLIEASLGKAMKLSPSVIGYEYFGQRYDHQNQISEVTDKPSIPESAETTSLPKIGAAPLPESEGNETDNIVFRMEIDFIVEDDDVNKTDEEDSREVFPEKQLFPIFKVEYEESEIDSKENTEEHDEKESQDGMEDNVNDVAVEVLNENPRSGRKEHDTALNELDDIPANDSDNEIDAPAAEDSDDDDNGKDEIKDLVKNEEEDDSVESGSEFPDDHSERFDGSDLNIASFLPINLMLHFVTLALLYCSIN